MSAKDAARLGNLSGEQKQQSSSSLRTLTTYLPLQGSWSRPAIQWAQGGVASQYGEVSGSQIRPAAPRVSRLCTVGCCQHWTV